jgi:Putative prokaryotic signal transducing protein
MDEPVRLTVVSDELEAEALCGLLRSAGIACGYRPTEEEDSPFEGFSSEGRQEILVDQADLEDATALLADAQS